MIQMIIPLSGLLIAPLGWLVGRRIGRQIDRDEEMIRQLLYGRSFKLNQK